MRWRKPTREVIRLLDNQRVRKCEQIAASVRILGRVFIRERVAFTQFWIGSLSEVQQTSTWNRICESISWNHLGEKIATLSFLNCPEFWILLEPSKTISLLFLHTWCMCADNTSSSKFSNQLPGLLFFSSSTYEKCLIFILALLSPKNLAGTT